MKVCVLITVSVCPYFSLSYFFLTGNFGVSLKQLYTQYIGWYICFAFGFNFHVEGYPFLISFSHFIVSFIVTLQLLHSWLVKFITCYWMHRAIMSRVCKKWSQKSTWNVKCKQQRTSTEQNVTFLMLTYLSPQMFIRAVCLKSVSFTQNM